MKAIERTGLVHGWTPRLHILAAKLSTTGTAALWFRAEDPFTSWEDLKTEYFPDSQYEDEDAGDEEQDEDDEESGGIQHERVGGEQQSGKDVEKDQPMTQQLRGDDYAKTADGVAVAKKVAVQTTMEVVNVTSDKSTEQKDQEEEDQKVRPQRQDDKRHPQVNNTDVVHTVKRSIAD